MTSVVRVHRKFVVMVLTGMLCIVHCLASYGQGMPRIGPYGPVAHENEDPRFEVPQVRNVDCWTPVPPHWLVGIVRELPEVPGLPWHFIMPDFPLGVVAVNLSDGSAKWLDDLESVKNLGKVHSLVSLGSNRCGIVFDRQPPELERGKAIPLPAGGSIAGGAFVQPPPPHFPEYVLAEWKLQTDLFCSWGEWGPVNRLARFLDFSQVCVAWSAHRNFNEDSDPAVAPLVVRHRATGRTVLVPRFWESLHPATASMYPWSMMDSDNTWYAPASGGAGIIAFQGELLADRQGGLDPLRSVLTAFDPLATGGIRWQIPLAHLVGARNERQIVSVFPIHHPWKPQEHLIVEIIGQSADLGPGNLLGEVAIVRVNLTDGACERLGGFPAFPWMQHYGRTHWPQLSADQKSIVYFEPQEPRPTSRASLRIFSVSTGQLSGSADAIPVHSTGDTSSGKFIIVSPRNEAVLFDDGQLSAYPLSDKDSISPFVVHRLVAPRSREPEETVPEL